MRLAELKIQLYNNLLFCFFTFYGEYRLRGKVKALSLVVKVVLVLVCLVVVIPSVIFLFPSLVDADCSYVVLGGSMKPTLYPGDLVFVKDVDPTGIEVGDIVTVKCRSRIYTHRVFKKKLSDGEILFRLKGDANEEPDASYVKPSDIVGVVCFSVPTGYFYTPYGYLLTVTTPLILLAVNQAIKIYRFYASRKRWRRGLKALILGRKDDRRKISILDTTSVLLLLILAGGCTRIIAPRLMPSSVSYYLDTEATHVLISAGTWRNPSIITCSVSPNSTITLGENVTVSGLIDPAHGNVVVKLTYECNGTTVVRDVTTDVDGTYEDVYAPERVGVWSVVASWKGDGDHYSATSGRISFRVEEGA